MYNKCNPDLSFLAYFIFPFSYLKLTKINKEIYDSPIYRVYFKSMIRIKVENYFILHCDICRISFFMK